MSVWVRGWFRTVAATTALGLPNAAAAADAVRREQQVFSPSDTAAATTTTGAANAASIIRWQSYMYLQRVSKRKGSGEEDKSGRSGFRQAFVCKAREGLHTAIGRLWRAGSKRFDTNYSSLGGTCTAGENAPVD